jgi:hypothetical protein
MYMYILFYIIENIFIILYIYAYIYIVCVCVCVRVYVCVCVLVCVYRYWSIRGTGSAAGLQGACIAMCT